MNQRDADSNPTRSSFRRRGLRESVLASLCFVLTACASSSSIDESTGEDAGTTTDGATDAGRDADAAADVASDAPAEADAPHEADTGSDAGDGATDADASDGDASDGDASDGDATDEADAPDDVADATTDGDGGDACLMCICATGTCSSCNTETCNGFDDNCNGQIDEGDPGGGGNCTTGLLGVCGAGVEHCCTRSLIQSGVGCAIGAIACVPAAKPTAEICNGLDDDCDGVVDNVKDQPNVSGAPGSACSTGGLGLCGTGKLVCHSNPAQMTGSLDCVGNRTPGQFPEVCNGLDDDCDGAVDNGNPGGGVACIVVAPDGVTPLYPNNAPCGAGVTACTNGSLVCAQQVFATPETCNGVDDDCDGVVDGTPTNPHSLDGQACTPTAYPATSPCGATNSGLTQCVENPTGGATLLCNATVTPKAEVCNSVDDDCDGVIDDANPNDPNALCRPFVTSNQSSVVSLTCDTGTCYIPANGCAANDYDVDGRVSDGCECSGTVLGTTQASGTAVSVTYGSPGTNGATQQITGILPTTGANASAWVRVSFAGVPATTPLGSAVRLSVSLSSASSGEFVMDAYDATNGLATCPVPGGTPTGETPVNLTAWDFVRSHTPDADGFGGCAASSPTNVDLCTENAPVPTTMSFRIHRANTSAAASCNTFTLTVSNTNQ